MQVKAQFKQGLEAHREFAAICDAVGFNPKAPPRTVHEAFVCALPGASKEVYVPLIGADLAATQGMVRKTARDLLSQGKLGSAQVKGKAFVGLIFRRGRNLLAFLSGSRLIWKWDEEV